ncbi:hypothetical protein VitviT2T_029318 [Vitis vinifera]|uniref:Uncharacterized protein n=1 Tax=Vitis vinifera TaxID=29760 RepID=A0ABY9DZ83_VITVI|nr:hypothetical protein VitviT2T_029318 [Vitis vinifera]
MVTLPTLGIPITLAPRVERATVIARATVSHAPRGVRCYSVPRNPRWWLPTSRESNHSRTPSHTCYSDCTRPEAYVATVLARSPRWWLMASWDSNQTRTPSRTSYSVNTKPEMVGPDISGFQSHSHHESRSLQ